MKVAAYQAPVASCYSPDAILHIREQVRHCEARGVELLCCPEGALGGLADYVDDPNEIAIDVGAGELEPTLASFASDSVTTVVGFTECDGSGRLFNSALVLYRGQVVGIYRKRHPAIHSSKYTAGTDAPVFTIGACTFGILICRDSQDDALAASLVANGATALLIPTNNAMPRSRGGPELVRAARELDVRRAAELGVAVVRADVVGEKDQLVSSGASSIVDRTGTIRAVARAGQPGLVVAAV
ncbi:MAG: carbon-nitrogen hydrolase family protein [Gemmatimonadales bacterium]